MPRGGKQYLHSIKNYYCIHCDYKATNKKAMELHLGVTHQIKGRDEKVKISFKCNACKKPLTTCRC